MKIGVIGSGALGLYYGSLLQRAGHEVAFLLRRDFTAIRRQGLFVTSPRGDFHLPRVQGFRESREMGPVDLVLIGLKAYANSRLIELVRPLVTPRTRIINLQNGLGGEELLATAFAPSQIIGGTAFLCCNRGEPGTVHHLDQGAVRLAAFDRNNPEGFQELAEMFIAAGIPCEICSDLTRMRWEKLVWNIPFNGLCALTGLPTDQLLETPALRREIVAMMHEVIAAANGQSLREPIAAASFIDRMITATAGMGAYQPSMMIDRLNGRPLELEAIYGIPLERAAAQGVAMVRVGLLHALLSATESGAAARQAPIS